MSQFITSHHADGSANFNEQAPDQQKEFPIPLGKMTLLYSTHNMPEDVSGVRDIEQYLVDREGGFGPGVACPPGGSAASILHIKPGLKSPMRRQPTIGVFYVLEGEMVLHLDGGDSRRFKAGDSGVLRGANHSWSNETPGEGWAKIVRELIGRTLPVCLRHWLTFLSIALR